MRKFFLFPIMIVALSVFVSCQKQQTEEEKNAEVERKVQERLAAERQTEQQQQLAQRQAELDAREKALADKQNAAAPPAENAEREESRTTVESRARSREPRERSINVGYSTFYNKLEPYGDWIETNDYGYVFYPRQAESSRSWRPYTNGRWVYTDVGWTWISQEPFGWATYHYGRWTRLRGVGWVWVPGNQWAPAWVSWRKGGEYVGWAPLPPEARFDQRTGIHNWSDNYYDVGPDQYCFVASREFGAPRVEQTLVPPERNVTIINQTTNVTNITYNNTTIVNEGPNYDEVRSVSREPVQRYRLERNTNVDFESEPRGEVRGETIVIAAPVIAQPVANERPATVKQTIAAAAVDLGWAAIVNQEEVKKTRQKMKSEATPPPNAPSKKFVKAESTSAASTQSTETSTTTSTSTSTATAAPSATAAPRSTASATATVAPTMTPHRAATVAPTATAAPRSTASATATVAPTMRPHRAATVAPTATAAATSSSASSPIAAPTASQRRGRLLVPSATPSPQPTSTAASQFSPATSPSSADGVPTRAITPPPQESPLAPVQSPPSDTRGKFKSQAQRYQPSKKVEPMPSASAPVTPTSTSSPSTTEAAAAPAEKMTRQEKKELKREQRQEMKRERRGGNALESPSPTP